MTMQFEPSETTTAEIEAAERLYGGLTDDVRALLDVVIRTRTDEGEVASARSLIQQATDLLSADAHEGPAGVHFNHEGRSWNWGNAVVGVRNAVAPPLKLTWVDDGSVTTSHTLGPAYEGPPSCVHGGVAAMMLDHLMGETASAAHTRLTVTGTLTLVYRTPLPLGEVFLDARITEEVGRKVTVEGFIRAGSPDAAPSVEATGLFIVPRWAAEAPEGIGSLD